MKTVIAVITGIATCAALVAPAHAGSEHDVVVKIEVAVKLDPGASIDAVVARAGLDGSRPLLASRNVHGITASSSVHNGNDPKKVAKAVEDIIKDLEKDDRVQWATDRSPSAASDQRFYAWPATDQEQASAGDMIDQPAFADLELDAVHDIATGEGVVVAVLDSGIERRHPMFQGRVLRGYDMVNDDAHAGEYADGIDQDRDGQIDEAHGHGTFVAGVVLQIAPDARVLPVRVLNAEGHGHVYAVVEGIDYAIAEGADIINMSFGLDPNLKSKAVEQAVKRARNAGVIVVAAAGNYGNDEKHFPASEDGVISVTALDGGNQVVANFATRGKWVTVAAPGYNIVSATTDDRYARWAGTSMAAPVVAAAFALVAETRPGDKAKKIEDTLLKASKKTLRKNDAEGTLDLLDALT